jgi:hypothetical protein
MPLTINDLKLNVDLPKLPQSMSLFETESPTLAHRGRAIEIFRETLNLGDSNPVELPDSIAFASKRGEVEFFRASGAIWARDADAETSSANELREWPDIEEVQQGNDVAVRLAPKAADTLVRQAQDLLRAAELLSEYVGTNRVVLEQVSHLSERGKLITRGAGVVTVIFDYELDGFPVFGAGGKSQIFSEPSRTGSHTIGAFHCWRSIVSERKIQIQAVEDALAVGVLQDPELNLYHKRGGRIEINRLGFGYMALPAMVYQRYLFPVFQIEGQVFTPNDKQKYFEFARYHHAVSQEQYGEVGAFADYLIKAND